MIELPDVNVLVALLDPSNVYHSITMNWFLQAEPTGWATCGMTESGYVRVTTSIGINHVKIKPIVAGRYLREFLMDHAATHHFIPDTARIVDDTRFNLRHLTGHKQVTDLHLMRLCQQNGLRLVTLDNALRHSAHALVQPPTNLIHFLLPLPSAAP
jgi:uncharacterized protein